LLLSLLNLQIAVISSSSNPNEFELKQQNKREILRKIFKEETEYWQLYPQEAIVISDGEATSQLGKVEQAVKSIAQKPSSTYPPELISLLQEIRDELKKPDKSASAKLKMVLPLIPAIASYELEMETEGLMSGAWKAIKEMVRKPKKPVIKWWLIGTAALVTVASVVVANVTGVITALKDASNEPGISLGENLNAVVGTCVAPGIPDKDSFITQFDAVFNNKTFKLPCDFLDQELIDNWPTAMAYDATWIIVTGLEQISEEKQQIGRKELNDVLIAPEFIHDGATGKTEFSDSGVNENQHDVLIQIKDGQFIKIDD
jgi:hypothetical protein